MRIERSLLTHRQSDFLSIYLVSMSYIWSSTQLGHEGQSPHFFQFSFDHINWILWVNICNASSRVSLHMVALRALSLNTWVSWNVTNWLDKSVAMSSWELLLVVCAKRKKETGVREVVNDWDVSLPSISNDNLWRILVWHYNGWTWESASICVWMVYAERLSDHTGVHVWSYLELIPKLNKG